MIDSTPFATDTLLWNAFREGDVQAFERLYRDHAGPLLTYGKRLCSDTDQVADAVQDVFLEIWKRRATLTTPTTIRYYLFRVMRNRLISNLNHRSNPLQQANELTGIEDLFSTPSIETLLSESDTQKSQITQLRRAVEILPPRQREALVLTYYHQFSNEEIAALMSINPQSVTNNLSRAINTLRQLLTCILWFTYWLLVTLSA